ncbi:3-deoxy-7-phosphoheptulonate synthase [Thiotrichales bacterium 19S9-12]|nr:3-deoxy-7-phosphoheptulonate synthase [Thiotrichales bacterium 19S9-11]MCF6811705.1 3-deoxy-7-phosphoheptulonate synthase [Thiotrichales bacterium 19S9-12]
MMYTTDDVRITGKRALIPSLVILEEFPITDRASQTIYLTRQQVHNCLYGDDDRLVVVVGPCSVHDLDAALEYGEKLLKQSNRFNDELVIIMRTYFEKPRTTIGWKGFINDPDLNNSFNINKGLRLARQLLLELSDKGLPCGTEFLDVISPQYIGDLVSWGAIGARTTESQIHRQLVSGLSSPIGFKNATDGNINIAIDAIHAAQSPHHFLSVSKEGNTAIFQTRGNEDTHVILRGGKGGPNYDAQTIINSSKKLEKLNLQPRLMIDCSHGNSSKDYRNQPKVIQSICDHLTHEETAHKIFGVMIESHLLEGNQSIHDKPLVYGKSITDACVSWDMTLEMLEQLAEGVKARRKS